MSTSASVTIKTPNPSVPPTKDKMDLVEIKKQVAEVTSTMQDNMFRIMDRGETLQDLSQKTRKFPVEAFMH